MAAEEVSSVDRTTKKVCLLTGASGRLGTAFCRLFADQYHILAVHRSHEPRVPTQRQWHVDPLEPSARISENRHPVFAVRADLADDREIERVVELTLARFDAIDLIINAAGHSVWGGLVDSSRVLESAERQFRINTIVPAKLATVVARAFWRDRDQENRELNRNVINVSSSAGTKIYRGEGQSVYSASKVALNFLTRHMADEFEPLGVRVNAVAPNSFPSLIPTRAVARALCEIDQSSMNGRVLVIDKRGQRLR